MSSTPCINTPASTLSEGQARRGAYVDNEDALVGPAKHLIRPPETVREAFAQRRDQNTGAVWSELSLEQASGRRRVVERRRDVLWR